MPFFLACFLSCLLAPYVYLSQRHYIEQILKRFNMENCRPAPTPYIEKETLHPYDGMGF